MTLSELEASAREGKWEKAKKSFPAASLASYEEFKGVLTNRNLRNSRLFAEEPAGPRESRSLVKVAEIVERGLSANADFGPGHKESLGLVTRALNGLRRVDASALSGEELKTVRRVLELFKAKRGDCISAACDDLLLRYTRRK